MRRGAVAAALVGAALVLSGCQYLLGPLVGGPIVPASIPAISARSIRASSGRSIRTSLGSRSRRRPRPTQTGSATVTIGESVMTLDRLAAPGSVMSRLRRGTPICTDGAGNYLQVYGAKAGVVDLARSRPFLTIERIADGQAPDARSTRRVQGHGRPTASGRDCKAFRRGYGDRCDEPLDAETVEPTPDRRRSTPDAVASPARWSSRAAQVQLDVRTTDRSDVAPGGQRRMAARGLARLGRAGDLARLRGRSGSRPRARVRWSAWSWPGDDRDDRAEPLGRPGGQADRPRREVERRVVVRDDHQLAAEFVAQPPRSVDEVDPGRTRTGRPRGPARPARRGPAVRAGSRPRSTGRRRPGPSSLSLSAHSRAVAYSKPRAMTSARVGGRLVGARSARSRARGRATRASVSGMAATAARSAGSSASAADSSGDREQLGGVGLGRGDRPFRAGARARSSGPAAARQRRLRLVGDRDRRRALARASAMTATMSGDAPDWLMPMTSASRDVRRRAVDRDDRRRPEPDRQPMPDAEHVLGVDRGVVGGAAGGDDDVATAARAQRRGDRLDVVGLVGEEPGGDLGLLADLVAERHRAAGRRPRPGAGPGSRSRPRARARAPRVSRAGSSTSRSPGRRPGRPARPTASAARPRRSASRSRRSPGRAPPGRLAVRLDRPDDDGIERLGARPQAGDLGVARGDRHDDLVDRGEPRPQRPPEPGRRRTTTCRPGSGRSARA